MQENKPLVRNKKTSTVIGVIGQEGHGKSTLTCAITSLSSIDTDLYIDLTVDDLNTLQVPSFQSLYVLDGENKK